MLSLPQFQMFKQQIAQFTYYRHHPWTKRLLVGAGVGVPLCLCGRELWRYWSGSGQSLLRQTQQNYKDKAQTLTNDLVREVLVENPKITRAYCEFLSKLFKDDQTTSSLIQLILNVLHTENFIEASKVFGIDLISHAIIADPTLNSIQICLVNA